MNILSSLKAGKARGIRFALVLLIVIAGWQLLPIMQAPEIGGLAVTRGELIQVVTLPAKVAFPEQFEITASQSGKVATVAVSNGDRVKAGQIVLTLDNARERAQLAEAKKAVALSELRFKQAKEKLRSGSDRAVEQANASLGNAKKQYARISNLVSRGLVSQAQAADALQNLAISQNQLHNAQFQAKASRAQGSEYALADSALKNARELAAAAQQKLDNTQVRSPHDGVVTSAQIAAGQRVSAGATVMQLASASNPQVQLNLAEANMKLVKPGAAVAVLHDHQAGIAQEIPLGNIPQDFDNTQSAASLAFRLDAAVPKLVQSAPVQLQIEVGHLQDVLSLDASAIHEARGSQPWVMAVRDGKARRQNIRLGANGRAGASHTLRMQVLEGLHEGDIVLPASAQDIEEGKRIRLARNG